MKITVPKHYCLVSKFVSHRDYGITILKFLHMYTKVEQISKYIRNNESQVSQYWRKEFQIRKGGSLERNYQHWVVIRCIRMNLQSLIGSQIFIDSQKEREVMDVYTHTCISQLCQLRGPRSNENTLHRNFVFKYQSPIKIAPWRNDQFLGWSKTNLVYLLCQRISKKCF